MKTLLETLDLNGQEDIISKILNKNYNQMNKFQLFKLLKAARFFPKYAPGVAQFYHKMNEWDGRKEIEFSDDDNRQIKEGVNKLIEDLKRFK